MILVCLRKNPLTRNATEAKVAGVVKIWMRTAPDRQGGRNKRRTKTAEEGEDGTPALLYSCVTCLIFFTPKNCFLRCCE
ncbi:hypothetical protein JTB14_015962 [Gonioctena quinquepunctata]|nr:hypothetical protein JTB14_015962 [Gonioctena quinquepunctata]